MLDLGSKDYIIIVQCHIVKEICPGYYCEQAFHRRTGGFAEYPPEKDYRVLSMTCGGCCGRALHRKLAKFKQKAGKAEQITPDKVIVQLSSCITRDNYHAPPCPHLAYLKTLIARVGFEVREDTRISARAEQRRAEGCYAAGQQVV